MDPSSCQLTEAKSGSTDQPRTAARRGAGPAAAQAPVVTPTGVPGAAARTAASAAASRGAVEGVDARGVLRVDVQRAGAGGHHGGGRRAQLGPGSPAERDGPPGGGDR